ncbi:single-stranded-DNA-specific exonuclease RecJ [Pararhizobium haloflavum]|uniref:single-stranded-DNA-specific exonuclease RecJ n=1 Tax=Pararhizobium haloflavum TaxID=2037914 RepID=UPI001FE155B4|nr:single-stranded-DNA-specific exonuclease RecJ [Pararhizobium haloflavum]
MPMERERAFLDVEMSLTGQRWSQRLDQSGRNRALAMAQSYGMSEIVARVLAGRGVGLDEAQDFLDPTLKKLMPDPQSLTDMERAVTRLSRAIRDREAVAIFGDYDVDGACASALMKRFFDHFSVPSDIYIPDRIFEGYGPNARAIGDLIDRGARLIVTVDCGSTSHDALAEAAKRGVDVIVIDHHQLSADLPPCHALVNPNREDDLSGQGHLCAAGVVFLVLVATLRRLREEHQPGHASLNLLNWLDLVALATVCDVVPLKGLNRAYVVKGLVAARHLGNPGLAALVRSAGVGGPLTPYHFGFLLGPRINAGGRIGDAALGSRLLTLGDAAAAEEIAVQLEALNRERQAMERAMLEEAEAEALYEYASGTGPAIFVTAKDGWHPGIVGLIASRLKDRLRRPVFAIAFDSSGRGTGSGRSIAGFDLGRLVRGAVEQGLLVKGGGHAMAAGLTVERCKLGALRTFLEERATSKIEALTADSELKLDGALSSSGATVGLLDALEAAGPYGAGHAQPIFAFPRHRLSNAQVVGQDHLRIEVQGSDGGRLGGIAFRAADTALGQALMAGRGATFHFAGSIAINHWQGTQRVQLRLLDAAPA